jgi:hypothetical protein
MQSTLPASPLARRSWAPPRPPARAALAGLLALAAVAALAVGACGRDAEPARAAQVGAEAEWSWLLSAKRQLDDERDRLAKLGGPAPSTAAPAAGTPLASTPASSPGGPAAPAAAPVAGGPGASPREQLARDVDARAQELGRRLVAYLNADPPIEGARLSARQLAALRMKSDEDLAVARQFVERAGDYRQAADILEGALAVDPRNPRLLEELARLQAARYMTAARFARAAPGMTADQVRAALGPPNAHDVRAYPDKQVVAWFFPRDGGAAAAVWFAQRDGAPTAYLCDWNALPPPTAPAPPSAPPTAPPGALTPTTAPPAAPAAPAPPGAAASPPRTAHPSGPAAGIAGSTGPQPVGRSDR